ncbi:MAG: hypothetical protein LIP03_13410 [Bacteroidales bacterium]|nr:hypothetical protein [Bacteroidales bacterium]
MNRYNYGNPFYNQSYKAPKMVKMSDEQIGKIMKKLNENKIDFDPESKMPYKTGKYLRERGVCDNVIRDCIEYQFPNLSDEKVEEIIDWLDDKGIEKNDQLRSSFERSYAGWLKRI